MQGNLIAPLALACSGLLALGLSAWIGGRDDPRSRAIGVRCALIAIAIFIGAAALYWVGDRQVGVYAVVIGLLVVVNALAVSMLRQLRRPDGER